MNTIPFVVLPSTRTFAERADLAPRCLQLCRAALLLAAALAGCKSGALSDYVSPRVEGRAVDANTHQALAGVKVRRLVGEQNPEAVQPPHRGQVLESSPVVRTGRDGRFVVASVRDFSLLHHGGWYAVTLCFELAGYERFQTNYTLGSSTNLPSGEPLIEAGDVALRPIPFPGSSGRRP
jgi:hypothetical protein